MKVNFKHRNFRDDAFQPLATALGQMTLAWNDLHVSLLGLFWVVLKIQNGVVPETIWWSIKSDRAQRDMLGALAASPAIGHELPEKVRKEIAWLLKKANSVEDLRNDFLHTPFIKSGHEPTAFHGGIHARGLKLAGKDLLRECRWFYDTTMILRDYATAIEVALRAQRSPWPERPQLPNRGDTNEK